MSVNVNIDINAQELIEIEKKLLGGVISNTSGLVGNMIGMLGDQIKYWRLVRAKNYEAILAKIAQKGIIIHVDKSKLDNLFLYKWLNLATLESDDVLQELWASLFVGGIAGERLDGKIFIDILSSLTVNDANLLIMLFKHYRGRSDVVLPFEIIEGNKKMNFLSLANLSRLSLIEVFSYIDSSIALYPKINEQYLSTYGTLGLQKKYFQGYTSLAVC